MQRTIDRYRRSAFIRNVALLVSGSAVAQTFTIGAAPVLSRLYDPAEFGILALIVAVSSPLSVIASWRYELAIVMAKNDEDAAALCILSCFIVVCMSLLVALVMILGADWIAFQLETPAASFLMILVAVSVLFNGLHMIATQWATRRKMFRSQVTEQISRSGSIAVLQILAGLAQAGAKGLVYGRIAGVILATLVLALLIGRQDGISRFRSIHPNQIRRLAREHDNFPKYAAPRAVLRSMSVNFVPIYLVFLFNPAVAGLFWFTHRLLWMPTTLIGRSVSRVFYQRAAELHRNKKTIRPVLMKTTISLAAMGAIPTLIIVAFGPLLFGFVFGSQWHKAGVFAQWLVIWWYSAFCNVPSGLMVPVFGLQAFFLGFEVVAVTLRFMALAAGAILGNDITAIAYFSVMSATLNIFLISYIFEYTRRRRL